jgi:hypothetical protein
MKETLKKKAGKDTFSFDAEAEEKKKVHGSGSKGILKRK